MEDKKAVQKRFSKQLWQAGFIGMLEGALGGLVTGFYLNYAYNRPPNTRFFGTTYKVWYLAAWTIVGITFNTDREKVKISRQFALEEEIKRSNYISQETGIGKN